MLFFSILARQHCGHQKAGSPLSPGTAPVPRTSLQVNVPFACTKAGQCSGLDGIVECICNRMTASKQLCQNYSSVTKICRTSLVAQWQRI